ncbi:ABC transporter ATP-binding protein [Gracilimonas mengyeensis]|uniref:Cu-processing system ATP-binding protein n=1 Tax=Gracilimonas mengyeensis TaxID=1302730 RepID=A0A521F162_9BACT|nr:ABC transporter ATP-binding protein [Gracilimonas mengyeensis]SMO89942.1 Cu-processing system ATP-binding protein [Gracilimonas mengyeensis]
MIEFKNITKKFGKLTVLDGINLEIPDGQATGIVGPNGSGKTTAIKSLLGLVKPTEGNIYVNEETVSENWQYRDGIGYMPQVARYPENMTVAELFRFIKKIRNGEPSHEDELISYFGLEPELDKAMRTLSGGNCQKVGAVLSMMFNPDLLIFDEPTAGLDPRSSVQFKNKVRELKSEGKTILLTTHIMSEIEELADYLIFIVEGKIKYHGPMQQLLDAHKSQRLEGAVAKMMEEAAA